MDPKAVTHVTHAESETVKVAAEFAKSLEIGSVVTLRGGLGAGKTVFVRGVCSGLKVADRVTSPTFIFMNVYSGRVGGRTVPVCHFDFYRITTPADLDAFDLDDYLAKDNICLIEWPERVAQFLPADAIEVNFREVNLKKNRRAIEISQKGETS